MLSNIYKVLVIGRKSKLSIQMGYVDTICWGNSDITSFKWKI